MSDYVFGYGSLVNRATHSYQAAHPARIPGWRRTWRHVVGRQVAFLTAIPDENSTLDGLVANVAPAERQDLDKREHSYDRALAHDIEHTLGPTAKVHIYHAPPTRHVNAAKKHPILLSYLDVVVQGYLVEFGEAGVERFFDTTDGWRGPILNDRKTPVYPRHQTLSVMEKSLTDHHLDRVGAGPFSTP